MLPPESATVTQRRLDPQNRPTTSRRRKQDRWIDAYHRQAKDVLMDLWEQKANEGGKKASRRIQHPDPTRK